MLLFEGGKKADALEKDAQPPYLQCLLLFEIWTAFVSSRWVKSSAILCAQGISLRICSKMFQEEVVIVGKHYVSN